MQPDCVHQSSGEAGAPAAAVADDASAPLPALLQLYPELLQLVWEELQADYLPTVHTMGQSQELEDQHALHSTCRAMRHATSALVKRCT